MPTNKNEPVKYRHFIWMDRKSDSCYQALLEQITDYLVCDTKYWKETAMTILFLDNEKTKKLHYQRIIWQG